MISCRALETGDPIKVRALGDFALAGVVVAIRDTDSKTLSEKGVAVR